MATEYPPLGKSYVISYANNDRDYPIIGIRKDPRVDNYKIPNDLSPHPDSVRYPNHVFTGANPTNSDERVLWVYEILPSPWVPFTRYDDDLGPIQGRRRSVKNEGQQAILNANKRITYEGREGSAIVSNEIEETWEIKVDEDGNSLFPVKVRDFYDQSRGAVEESRQLIVPTGEEVATLENVNGVITQTSYEPYNEYLSYKVVQTYAVNGPQLVGNATNNEGQLVTVTTQRKASDNYVAPQPTATRTVETSREDAESLVERIVDTPEVFSSKLIGKEATDPAPAKFRIAAPTTTEEETVEGTVEDPILGDGDISKSEQQVSKFVKRIRSTFRDLLSLPKILKQKTTNQQGQVVTVTETLQLGDTSVSPTALKTVESEALGDGTYVVRTSEIPEVFRNLAVNSARTDLTPEKFKANQNSFTIEENIAGTVSSTPPELAAGEFSKSEEQVTEFVKRVATTKRDATQTKTLNELVVLSNQNIGTRTLTLGPKEQFIDAQGNLLIESGAEVVDGSLEDLGDGRFVKTVITENVFDEKTQSIEKRINIPERFLTSKPITTTSIVEDGTETDVTLVNDEISKQIQRVSNHKIRTTTSERDLTSSAILNGYEYDTTIGARIPYKEYVTGLNVIDENGEVSAFQPSNGESQPIGDGKTLVKEYLQSIPDLENIKLEFATRSSIGGVPPVLKQLKVEWQESKGEGSYSSQGKAASEGPTGSCSGSSNGSANGNAAMIPVWVTELEQVNTTNIPTTSYFFFIKYPVTVEKIKGKIGIDVKEWPIFDAASYTLTAYGMRVRSTARMDYNFDINYAGPDNKSITTTSGSGNDLDIENIINTIQIPPCIHGDFSQKVETTSQAGSSSGKNIEANATISAQVTLPQGAAIQLPTSEKPAKAVANAIGKVDFNLKALKVKDVPRSGTYLIDYRAEPYRYGYARVYAETVDAGIFAKTTET